jgi:hypothetical protein
LTRGLPEEFNTYLNYCRGLKFEEKPDYSYCRKLFKDFMYRSNFETDYMYDWILKKNGKPVTGFADSKPTGATVAPRQENPAPEHVEERKDAGRQQLGNIGNM